jgi:hypothetical protein
MSRKLIHYITFDDLVAVVTDNLMIMNKWPEAKRPALAASLRNDTFLPAVQDGRLPMRSEPLRAIVPPNRGITPEGTPRPDLRISVNDLWEWMKREGMSTTDSPEHLYALMKDPEHDPRQPPMRMPRTPEEVAAFMASATNETIVSPQKPPKSVGRGRTGGPDDNTMMAHWREIASTHAAQGARAIAQKIIYEHPDQYAGVTHDALRQRYNRAARKTGQNKMKV